MSKIATTTTQAILGLFAGQTVTQDEVFTQIEQQYAMARRAAAFGSFMQVSNALTLAGARTTYDGPNYTGTCRYTFPAMATA